MVSANSIDAAIKVIPETKASLKKAFEDVQAHSSSLASFTLQWKDLEDHISSIERSILDRFRELESKEKEHPSNVAALSSSANLSENDKLAPLAYGEEEPEVDPRPELRAPCIKMDGRGLRTFINVNRKDLLNIQLNRAMWAASDPAKLILDVMDGFYPANGTNGRTDGEFHASRRTCTLLLERVHVISPEIKPAVRERARTLAAEWKGKMSQDGRQNNVAFLLLLVSYGIGSEFEEDELLELLVPVVKRKRTIDLCRNLSLSDKMPGLAPANLDGIQLSLH